MKLLLTSQMIYNKSIADALASLLEKPFSEAVVAYIITSHNGAMGDKSWFVQNLNSLYDLSWKTFYMLDVAGLDGIEPDSWMNQLEEADVVVVGGGANYILSYWLDRSGLFNKLPKLIENKVYVGASAGSMLTQSKLCTSSGAMKEFAKGNWEVDLAKLGPQGRSSDKSLNLVDFLVRPHYGSEDREYVTDSLIQATADHFNMPIYAIDDQTAIKVVDEEATVVSEGIWRQFNVSVNE